MKVGIKSFDVEMKVKSKGIEFGIYSADGKAFLGDCYVTMTGLIWCDGKTGKDKGQKIKWEDFIALMSSPNILKKATREAKK